MVWVGVSQCPEHTEWCKVQQAINIALHWRCSDPTSVPWEICRKCLLQLAGGGHHSELCSTCKSYTCTNHCVQSKTCRGGFKNASLSLSKLSMKDTTQNSMKMLPWGCQRLNRSSATISAKLKSWEKGEEKLQFCSHQAWWMLCHYLPAKELCHKCLPVCKTQINEPLQMTGLFAWSCKPVWSKAPWAPQVNTTQNTCCHTLTSP